MKKGVAIPRGRMALPREPKNMGKDRILVFAEGRHLEEAKKAGADIVGGPELCDGVSVIRIHDIVHTSKASKMLTWFSCRSSVDDIVQLFSCVSPVCFVQSHRSSVVSWVRKVSCPQNVEAL